MDSSGGQYSEILDEVESYDPDRSERQNIKAITRELNKADSILQNTFNFISDLSEPVQLHPDLSGSRVLAQLRTVLSHLDAANEHAAEIAPTNVNFGVHDTLSDSLEYLTEEIRTILSHVKNVNKDP